jgi:Zn-dependent peptidase ImmA (M78 family)
VESNDHPIRSMDEIEKLADGLNHTYCTDHTRNSLILPIPIEDMAEHYLGYSIDFVDDGIFSDPKILGGIDFEESKIYVNASVEDHDGRYAFTIAHEIGHHVLHRVAYLKDNVDGNKEILCRDSRNKPQIELEADRFAAALLMPAEAIQNITSTISPRPKVNSIKQARGLASKIINEGKLDNVSNTAMVNRLIDLEIISSTIGYQRGINSIYKRRSLFSLFLSRIFNKIS